MIADMREDPDRSFFMIDSADIPHLEKLESSRECEGVWGAIEKRMDLASALHAKTLREIFGEDFERAKEIAETSFEWEVCRLVGAIGEALRSVSFHEGAKIAQRKQLLTAANKAVAELKRILVLLSDDEVVNLDLSRRLDKFGQTCAARTITDLSKVTTPGWEKYAAAAADPVAAAIAEFSAMSVTSQPSVMLDAIQAGVFEWASRDPLIPKPGSQNADRLRMIRVLTQHFKWRYATPLRAQVLAIVGIYFDATGLSESDIAKLAP